MEVAHEYGLEYVRPNGMAGFPSLRGDVKERLTEVHIQISDSGVSQTLATVMFTRPLDAGILIVLDDDAVRTDSLVGKPIGLPDWTIPGCRFPLHLRRR